MARNYPVFGPAAGGVHSATRPTGRHSSFRGNVGAVHYSTVPCWPIDTVYYVEVASRNLHYNLLDSLNLAKLIDRRDSGLSRDITTRSSLAPPMNKRPSSPKSKSSSPPRRSRRQLEARQSQLSATRPVLKAAVGRLVETISSRREGSFETDAQLLQQPNSTRPVERQGIQEPRRASKDRNRWGVVNHALGELNDKVEVSPRTNETYVARIHSSKPARWRSGVDNGYGRSANSVYNKAACGRRERCASPLLRTSQKLGY